MIVGAVWIIMWNNPYTNPPNGMPRVLAEFYYDIEDPQARIMPEAVMDFYKLHRLHGSGYGIHWQAVSETTSLNQEALSNIRKKRLERKMKTKYPLFAEQFIEEEIRKKPDYYRGVTDAEIENKRARVLEDERKRFQKLIRDRVIIYWTGERTTE